MEKALDSLWLKLKANECDDRHLEEALVALCALANSSQYEVQHIRRDCSSLLLLRHCLVHPKSRLVRKCAVELIVRLCVDGYKIVSICDALEEKQLHLVRPALKQLQNLQNSSQNERKGSVKARDFLSTLYLRALTHSKCQRFAIAALLQFVYSFQKDVEIIEEDLSVLYDGFLLTVQEVIVFVRMHEDKTLDDFLETSAALLTKLCMRKHELCTELLQRIASVRWNSLALFQVLRILQRVTKTLPQSKINNSSTFDRLNHMAMRMDEKCLRPYAVCFIADIFGDSHQLSQGKAMPNTTHKDDLGRTEKEDLASIWKSSQHVTKPLHETVKNLGVEELSEENTREFVFNVATFTFETQRSTALAEYTHEKAKEMYPDVPETFTNLQYAKMARAKCVQLCCTARRNSEFFARMALEKLTLTKCNAINQPGTDANRRCVYLYQFLLILDFSALSEEVTTAIFNDCYSMLCGNQPPPPLLRALIELLLIKYARDEYGKASLSKILPNEKHKNDMCMRRYRLSSVVRRVCEFDSINAEKRIQMIEILLGGVANQHFATACYCIGALHELLLCKALGTFWAENRQLKSFVEAVVVPATQASGNKARFVVGMCEDFIMTHRLTVEQLLEFKSIFDLIPGAYATAQLDRIEGHFQWRKSPQENNMNFMTCSEIPKAPATGDSYADYEITTASICDSADNAQRKPTLATVPRTVAEGRQKANLIVVASLIQSAANLGGLCRTCEILGAEKLIIPSLEKLTSAEFKTLSVTAENHIPIEECSAQMLCTFISRQNVQNGYKAVAIEQCTQSVPLHKYTFPKKTLLILGDERKGIPPDVLTICDDFVEIAQVGLTRSLNVHVCGSLAIYTYAIQHVLERE